MTRRAAAASRHLDPIETTAEARAYALESELRLLEPYASTKGLPQLRARVDELQQAIRRARGLPLEEAEDG